MPPSKTTYRKCPACARKTAVSRGLLVTCYDYESDVPALRCCACKAYSIGGVVVRSHNVAYRTNAVAAEAVAYALEKMAASKVQTALNLLSESVRDRAACKQMLADAVKAEDSRVAQKA